MTVPLLCWLCAKGIEVADECGIHFEFISNNKVKYFELGMSPEVSASPLKTPTQDVPSQTVEGKPICKLPTQRLGAIISSYTVPTLTRRYRINSSRYHHRLGFPGLTSNCLLGCLTGLDGENLTNPPCGSEGNVGEQSERERCFGEAGVDWPGAASRHRLPLSRTRSMRNCQSCTMSTRSSWMVRDKAEFVDSSTWQLYTLGCFANKATMFLAVHC